MFLIDLLQKEIPKLKYIKIEKRSKYQFSHKKVNFRKEISLMPSHAV